jgi:ABC-type antimicrobial peptide transport system permease subunit
MSGPWIVGFGLRVASGDRWFRVVGVVPDVHDEEVGESTEASRRNIYRPYAADGSRSMAFIIRSTAAPATLVEPARVALAALHAGFPVYRLMPMRELRRFTTWEQAFMGQLMTALAVAALLLACLGVYALTSYAVGRRSKEIGVRLALGATPFDVVRMLAKESGQVALMGTSAGLALR